MELKKGLRERRVNRSEEPVVYLTALELIARIARKTKIRKVDVKDLVDAYGEVVREALCDRQSVTMPGIGRIEYQVKTAKRRNMFTNIEIPSRPYPRLGFLPEYQVRTTVRRAFDAERERRLSDIIPTPEPTEHPVAPDQE